MFNTLISENDKYKSYVGYVKKCSSDGYIPYIPETAALDLVLLEMIYYKNTRDSVSDFTEMAAIHGEQRNVLFEIYQ